MKTNQWDNIFKKEGRVYFKAQEDMPTIVKLFKKGGIEKVLDLGCGSGRHTVYFSKKGFDTYGIDIAPIGLKMTKDWLKQEKLRANLKLGSIFKKLPYKSNFFDAIIAVQIVSHERIENIRKLIKEMDRILKPNGLIFVAFNQRSKVKNWRVGSIQKERFIGDDEMVFKLVLFWKKMNKKGKLVMCNIEGYFLESIQSKQFHLLFGLTEGLTQESALQLFR